MPVTPPVAVVVLAAGASRRLGRPKQLLMVGGQTLLARAVAVAAVAACGPVFVVLGCGAGLLRDELSGSDAWIVDNPDWDTGPGSSIRAGVAAVEASGLNASAILFIACDQPLLSPQVLLELVAAHRSGHKLAASTYAGSVGIPALFARDFFGELMALPAEAGAKRLLTRHAPRLVSVTFPGGEFDIDVEADAARLSCGWPPPYPSPLLEGKID